MADFQALGVLQGDVAPPGAVVVPEMVVRVWGATGDELEIFGGHGFYHILVFFELAGSTHWQRAWIYDILVFKNPIPG